MNAEIITDRALILAPAPGQADLGWHVAGSDENAFAHWIRCRDMWLRSKERKSGRKNTATAYAGDWNQFFAHFAELPTIANDGTPTIGLMPWQVGRLNVEEWIEAMQDDGLAAATIIRRVSALSSYYHYASHQYSIRVPGRGEVPLWDHPNPFQSHDLPKPNTQPVFPTTNEVSRLLEQIDTRSATGLRNMALIAGIFNTTRRVKEWCELRWSDFHDGPDGHWFTYRYKGGEIKRQALDNDVYVLIVAYLNAAGRWPLEPDDYVFVALSDSARQFGGLEVDYDPAGQHISESYVWTLLHRYGEAAGIADLRKCHPHGLRHAGARYRKELGADIWQLQSVLGHKNINVTERYSREVLEQPQDPFADSIRNMLPRQLRLELGL